MNNRSLQFTKNHVATNSDEEMYEIDGDDMFYDEMKPRYIIDIVVIC